MTRSWLVACATLVCSCSVLVDPDGARLDRFSTAVDSGGVDRADDVPAPDVETRDAPDVATADVVTADATDVPIADVTDVPAVDVPDAPAVDAPDVPAVDVPGTDVPTVDVPTVDVPTSRCATSCDDGVECTVDSCDEASATCAHRVDDSICGPRERCDATMDCVRVDCVGDADCQDDTLCNGRERCMANRCVPGTAVECADAVECTVDACDPATGTCSHTADTARCDDGAFCNGAETCNPASGCQTGPAPTCNDGVACTADRCDESMRRCVYTPNPSACSAPGPCVTATCDPMMGCRNTPIADYCTSFCGGGAACDTTTGRCGTGTPRDCSDGTACTTDRCDPAAMMCRSTPVDADGDGFPAASVGGATCAMGTDCNDADPAINRSATERCNRVDDDCDGAVDEDGVCIVPGEDCARAIALNLTGSTTTLSRSGTTLGSTSDFTSSCSGAGPDLVYAVTLPGDADLLIEAAPTGDSDPVVSVRDTCGGPELGCNDDATQRGNDARVFLRARSTAGGTTRTVFVVVDEAGSRGGAFTLRLTRSTTIAPASCGSRNLFNVTAGGTVIGRTSTGNGSHYSTCGGFGNGEDVLFFNATSRMAVNFLLVTGNQVAYIRQDQCAGIQADQLACFTGSSRTTLNAGSTWIMIDATRDSGEGFYIFRVQP